MARKSRKNDTLNEITVSKSNFTINTAFYIRLSVEDNKNRGNSIQGENMIQYVYCQSITYCIHN